MFVEYTARELQAGKQKLPGGQWWGAIVKGEGEEVWEQMEFSFFGTCAQF